MSIWGANKSEREVTSGRLDLIGERARECPPLVGSSSTDRAATFPASDAAVPAEAESPTGSADAEVGVEQDETAERQQVSAAPRTPEGAIRQPLPGLGASGAVRAALDELQAEKTAHTSRIEMLQREIAELTTLIEEAAALALSLEAYLSNAAGSAESKLRHDSTV